MMGGIVFERPVAIGPTEIEAVAFVTPRTPIEQAWADLCDGDENADVERVMASIGGWDAWAETPLPYLCFVGAFNGEPEHAIRRLEAAHGHPAL